VAGEISRLKMALERSLHDLGLDKRLKAEQIMALWPKLVGPAVTKIAYPAQLRNGTLFIDVADSLWIQELKFQERDLIERLNATIGEPIVRRLFLQLARMPLAASDEVAAAELPPHMETPLDPQQELAIEREVAHVRDLQLREVLKDFRRRLLQVRPPSSSA
jgi:hypothetical protein